MNILLVFPGFIIAFIIVLYYKHKMKNMYTKIDAAYKNKNKVHFYVARDPDGSLWLHLGKPFRKRDGFSTHIPDSWTRLNNKDTFKYFDLNQHDFDNLKWEDEPVEVFLNMEE